MKNLIEQFKLGQQAHDQISDKLAEIWRDVFKPKFAELYKDYGWHFGRNGWVDPTDNYEEKEFLNLSYYSYSDFELLENGQILMILNNHHDEGHCSFKFPITVLLHPNDESNVINHHALQYIDKFMSDLRNKFKQNMENRKKSIIDSKRIQYEALKKEFETK